METSTFLATAKFCLAGVLKQSLALSRTVPLLLLEDEEGEHLF